MSDIQVHPVVLLTGAGFTHNFGGYLATQMWEHIFNDVGVFQSAYLQALMKHKQSEFDYEQIYAKLRMKGDHNFDVYLAAMTKVYADLDEIVVRSLDQGQHGVSIVGLRRWIARRFNGLGDRPKVNGFIFSLNQDLFFERHARDDFGFLIPGLPPGAQAGVVQNKQTIQRVQLDGNTDPDKIRANFGDLNLIKLHGSCNWESSTGKGIMVLGEGKAEDIVKEPLLDFYLRLFAEVLSRPGLQLWVIGYGFRDPHINACIARSIRDHVSNDALFAVVFPRMF